MPELVVNINFIKFFRKMKIIKKTEKLPTEWKMLIEKIELFYLIMYLVIFCCFQKIFFSKVDNVLIHV